MLEVRLFGAFDIKYDGNPVIISSRLAQSLFAYLILNPGTSHRREKLAGIFWADAAEEKARAYLRHELWRIRKALSSKVDYLISNDVCISFSTSADYWLDVAVLKGVEETASIEKLMRAVSLYQGEFLPGFYEDWLTQEREHLQALYEQKMARLLELLQEEKRWRDILEWAEHWIATGQGPEAAYRYLMVAYEALGDPVRLTSTYERCRKALRVLDLEPSEQTRALAYKRNSKINIPIPLTSFIGRKKELQEVAELLSKSRLVTLTGSGGVGKTRLAIQVVAEVLDRFPNGVWFLDLAPLSDPTLVSNMLTNLLGLQDSGERTVIHLLTNYFNSRTALIIFDNCEHLIDSCAQLIHSLLTSCENLSILATSREALRVSGEISYRVPSLTVPRPDRPFAVHDLANLESIRLFTERAALIAPGFAYDSQNALDIARICQRLDGIPLAIELAAARTNVLSVQQILDGLDDRFHLLTRGMRSALPRHQTLRAMIEWSYELLSVPERLLFRRLAVFVGGWTLEAAQAICSGNGIETDDILDLLSQLANKSLVIIENSKNETRFRRLETIRQFAREKLSETTGTAQLRDRHFAYFLKKTEEIESYLVGAEQSAWMDYIELELDNFRIALEWSTSNKKGEESLRLVGSLAWFCYIHCHCREGLKWFWLALKFRHTASKKAQAKAIGGAGWLNYGVGDFSAASSCHRKSAKLYRQLDDQRGLSTQLQFLGVVESARGNSRQARPIFEESLRISRRVNNKLAIPRVLIHLADYSRKERDYVTTWCYYEEALAICRELQEGHLTHVVLGTMGHFALTQKNNQQARLYFGEALEICVKLKNKRTIAELFLNFGEILCVESQYAHSARLRGFALTLLDESEYLTEELFRGITKDSDLLKTYLGEASYEKEFDIGRTLKLEQAIEIALQQQVAY